MNSELARKFEVSTMASKPGVPKSGAISKGYNFASHWEQVLFLLPSFSNWPKFKFFMSVVCTCASEFCTICLLQLQLSSFVSDQIRLDPLNLNLMYSISSLTLQNAPLTEQQQAAIANLSHAVAERPLPPNLVRNTVHLSASSIINTILSPN